jgi:hypothetical protein
MTAMLLFYIIKKLIVLITFLFFSKIYYLTSYGTIMSPYLNISRIRHVVITNIGNYKLRHWNGVEWHNAHSNLSENLSTSSKVGMDPPSDSIVSL